MRHAHVRRTFNGDGSITYYLGWYGLEGYSLDLDIGEAQPKTIRLNERTAYSAGDHKTSRSRLRVGATAWVQVDDGLAAVRVDLRSPKTDPGPKTLSGTITAITPPKMFTRQLFRTEPGTPSRRVGKTRIGPREYERDAAYARRARTNELNSVEDPIFWPRRVELAAEDYIKAKADTFAKKTADGAEETVLEFIHYVRTHYHKEGRTRSGPANVSGLGGRHVANYRDWLLQGRPEDGKATSKPLVAASVNTKILRIRAWLRWCRGENLCLHNAAEGTNLARETRDAKAKVLFKGAQALWDLIAKLREGKPRRAEIVGVLCTSGLRITEASQLRWPDYDRAEATLRVRRIARETTKRHERLLPVGEHLKAFLDALKADSEGPWIIGPHKGKDQCRYQVNYFLQPHKITPHDCRRWFRTSLEGLDAMIPDTLIDDMLGHQATKVRSAYSNGLSPDEYGVVDADRLNLARQVIQAFDEWLRPGASPSR